MPPLPFFKMTASGNDFAVFDNRGGVVPSNPKWVAAVCRRSLGVGADGIIAVEASRKAHFKMRYFNADGREAEFCGNGLRCAARFAFLEVIAPREMRVETRRGVRRAEVRGREVSVEMEEPSDVRLHVSLEAEGRALVVHFTRAEVPHAVVFAENIEAYDVEKSGRAIRSHPAFAPEGTNVTFAERMDEHTLKIRTYERGIEGETLACGTGSAAAAFLAAKLGLCSFPARVLPRGGGVLALEPFPGEKNLRLSGAADIVYAGKLWDDIFLTPGQ